MLESQATAKKKKKKPMHHFLRHSLTFFILANFFPSVKINIQQDSDLTVSIRLDPKKYNVGVSRPLHTH